MEIRNTTIILVLAAWLVIPMSAYAKSGAVVLEGTVSDVKVEGEVLSFLFSGHITFDFYTAPYGNPKRKWEKVDWQVEKMPVRATKWKHELDAYPTQPANAVTFSNAVKFATARAKDGKSTQMGVYRAKLSFSDKDEIIMIEGEPIAILPDEAKKEDYE